MRLKILLLLLSLLFVQAFATAQTRPHWLQLQGTPIVDVRSFGVTGDGVTDDTAAIAAALASGGTIVFPAGTYMVDGTNGGVKPQSNTHIYLHPSAKIKLINENSAAYQVVLIDQKSNVTIEGGTIEGNVDESTLTTGGAGIGIYIRYSDNINIRNVHTTKCWDGTGSHTITALADVIYPYATTTLNITSPRPNSFVKIAKINGRWTVVAKTMTFVED